MSKRSNRSSIIIRRGGRPPKHGIYSLAAQDRLLAKHPHIKSYALAVRDAWIAELIDAHGSLTASQKVLVDRANSKLVLLALIEESLAENGIWRRDMVQRRKVLACEPCFDTYGALDNALRRDLILLGIKKQEKQEDGLAAFRKYIGLEQTEDGAYEPPAPVAPKDAPGSASEGQTAGAQGKDEGSDGQA